MNLLETVHNSWFLWMIAAAGLVALLRFLAKTRRTEVQPGMATKSDQFSMRTVFLSFRSGEAGLFFTVLLILINCLLFSVSVAREVVDMFGG
ncbi:MAG: hypothetical protein A2527_02205 [Candidatus Lambdaproteobacteria bacterium RIFOXYD2_FULL_50_16]|uniref:Uncharacterized protein n=1 Tax=Candidatus Lambdaproteobacteria bacterium RIFOXYD2_FULL_50_16 TaxID=1817772 RepID=A0A1F6GDW2_9PROT|nr:MAG: hypothetical protein A2527_02205 [Candidatus Lambdaproteobacteria bacterium RIFOXYD2_FULL_50_16]